jgi:hypothetical protein
MPEAAQRRRIERVLDEVVEVDAVQRHRDRSRLEGVDVELLVSARRRRICARAIRRM